MTRILIVRLGAMGDVVHALSAVTALRAALPDAHIGWAIEERWSALLCAPALDSNDCDPGRGAHMPLVDAIHFVNTKAWRAAPFSDGTWAEARATFAAMRAARYDAVLDFQGSLKSATVALLSGAGRRIGSARPWERVAALFYTHPVEVHSTHVVEQALEIASRVTSGVTSDTAPQHLHYIPPTLPLDPAAERWAEQELARRGVRSFALLHPGAGWGAKRWPAARYGEVAHALAGRGVTPLVNHGPDEQALAHEVTRASGGAAVGAIQCSISELIALTRRAKLAIGGDTGPLHLAAALEIPIVALYGPTDPRRTGPFGTREIVLRSEMSKTSHKKTDAPDPGLLAITTDQVIAAAVSLLEAPRG